MKYTLNDIFIAPAELSSIDSRNECSPHHTGGMLPLFTAPMSSVVNLDNYQKFIDNKITSILPRTVSFEKRINLYDKVWCAFSLSEFDYIMNTLDSLPGWVNADGYNRYILIDIANGNMLKLHNVIKYAKDKYGDKLQIMAGNIANPETYRLLSDSGADYVRLGIGSGSVCITSSNTAIHYPMASLIKECFEISLTIKNPAKIIADGGIKGFGDIQKALALGADYVMCGSVFNKMLESAGDTAYSKRLCDFSNIEYVLVNQYSEDILNKFNDGLILYKSHYGMSTKKAQKEIGSEILKTSEGIEKLQKVEYTMSKWVENFTDYLKSTMSYTNSRELYDFIGNVETIIVSNSSYDSVNK